MIVEISRTLTKYRVAIERIENTILSKTQCKRKTDRIIEIIEELKEDAD